MMTTLLISYVVGALVVSGFLAWAFSLVRRHAERDSRAAELAQMVDQLCDRVGLNDDYGLAVLYGLLWPVIMLAAAITAFRGR